MSTQTVPAGGFALKAKKADCLKFSRRGPLRSSVPAHIDGHKQDIVEVSSHQGPRGGLNTDPVIARNGRTTPRRASQSAGGARSGNATPNGTGTPRRASVVVSPTGSPYITGLTSTPSSTPVRAGLYDRSPARYAAPPLTANQQHLIAARSGRSVSPSDPNFNLLHSSSGEPHNNHHLHSAESTDGGEYQLDAVTVKYDPIALLLHGGIVNTTGTGGHNGGGRRNTRNLSPSANASATEVHDNVAARHRRTHAISLERAIEADQRQQSNLNTGIIRNTIKEMRRSVSPTTCGLAKSTFGAASVGPASPLKGGYIAGLSTTTNVPAPVGTRNDVITSPSYKLRKEPFSGDLYASPSSSLSSPQRRYDAANVSTASGASSPSKRGVADTTPNGRGANVSTCSVNASSISQSTTTKGPHVSHANNSTHNNGSRSPSANSRRVVTPRGTVTTSDYGTSVAYEPLTVGSAAKESPRRDAALSHHTEGADSKTPVKGGEVDGQSTEGANDAPQTVPLQHPGFFTKEKLHGTEDASPAAVEDSRV